MPIKAVVEIDASAKTFASGLLLEFIAGLRRCRSFLPPDIGEVLAACAAAAPTTVPVFRNPD